MGTILTIIGIIIAIILWQIERRRAKKNMQITKLEFRKKECFSLISSAVKKINIDVMYKEKKIANPLILFKGEIVNTGTKDIDKLSIISPLKIIIANNYEWLEVHLIENEYKVNSKVTMLSKNTIELEWDLLKTGEKIEFEALVENIKKVEKDQKYKLSAHFYDSIKFDHRIANLAEIDCVNKFEYLKKFKEMCIGVIVFSSVMILLGSLSIISTFYRIDFISNSKENIKTFVELSSKNNGKSSIYEIFISNPEEIGVIDNLGRRNKYTIENFNKEFTIKRIVELKEKFKILLRILGIILVGLFSFFIYFIQKDYKKERKKYS